MRPKYSTLPLSGIGDISDFRAVNNLPPPFLPFSNAGAEWTLPGTLSSSEIGGENDLYPAAYSFAVGPVGFGQFANVEDEDGNWLYNIPGDDVFRSKAYAYDTVSGTVVWSYRFDAAASSVTWQRTLTGDELGADTSPTSASQATIYGSDDDGDTVVKGNVTLSLKVGFEYLDETLENYFSQARPWKVWLATHAANLIDDGLATRSHSHGGRRCIVSGAELYAALTLRGNDIDEQGTPETGDDVIERFGYEQPFHAITQIVRRRNMPSLRDIDTGDGTGSAGDSYGVGIYRFGNAERKLLEVIQKKKWEDPHGLYDRLTPEALAVVGRGYAPDARLSGILPADPISGVDNTAEAVFASCDGMSYRLTIEAGNVTGGPGGDFTVLSTRTVTVPPGSGVAFSYSAHIAGATTVRVSKLEVLIAEVYEEVPIIEGTPVVLLRYPYPANVTGGTFSSTPGAGCRVLVVLRRRTGSRWGYGEYTQNGVGSYGDYDSVPYFAEQLTTLDFATDASGLNSVEGG